MDWNILGSTRHKTGQVYVSCVYELKFNMSLFFSNISLNFLLLFGEQLSETWSSVSVATYPQSAPFVFTAIKVSFGPLSLTILNKVFASGPLSQNLRESSQFTLLPGSLIVLLDIGKVHSYMQEL